MNASRYGSWHLYVNQRHAWQISLAAVQIARVCDVDLFLLCVDEYSLFLMVSDTATPGWCVRLATYERERKASPPVQNHQQDLCRADIEFVESAMSMR